MELFNNLVLATIIVSTNRPVNSEIPLDVVRKICPKSFPLNLRHSDEQHPAGMPNTHIFPDAGPSACDVTGSGSAPSLEAHPDEYDVTAAGSCPLPKSASQRV